MNKKQNEAEMKYRIAVALLDALFAGSFIELDEYDTCRIKMANKYKALIGLLESEDMLWKNEK